MPQFIAFLRGLNLGNRRVKMDVLRSCFEALKFTDVETFIASGNVIFSARATDAVALEAKIATHLEQSLGYEVDTFIRSRAEVAAIDARPPFDPSVAGDPAVTIHVGFLARELTPAQKRGLQACRSPHDTIIVEGREFYWLCRDIKSHESKIWASAELKALRLPSSSMRNITTIRKLEALYPPSGA